VEHYTPPAITKAARQVMGGIDLDPASCEAANQVVQARRFFTVDDDGLSRVWAGTVWLNPPYGKAGKESSKSIWTRRLIREIEHGSVTEACLLVTASMSDGWFQPIWRAASALCFPNGRLQFWSCACDGRPALQSGNPTQNVVAYFGPNAEWFADSFQRIGTVVTNWVCQATPEPGRLF